MLKIQKKEEQALKIQTNIFLVKKISKSMYSTKKCEFLQDTKKAHEKLFTSPNLATNKEGAFGVSKMK